VCQEEFRIKTRLIVNTMIQVDFRGLLNTLNTLMIANFQSLGQGLKAIPFTACYYGLTSAACWESRRHALIDCFR
jgi:hypothetical protein